MPSRSPEVNGDGEFRNSGSLQVARAIRGTKLLESVFPRFDFPHDFHSSLSSAGGYRYAILFVAVTSITCGVSALCVGILSNLPTLK